MNGNIVEKVEVRRKLNAYKTVVKDKMNNIHKELDEMKNACTTTAMENVWLSSKDFTKKFGIHGKLHNFCNNY